MTKRSPKPFRMAPLQEFVLEPITDPAKQSALDEQRRQGEQIVPAPCSRGAITITTPATGSQLLDLTHYLPPEEKFLLTTQMLAQLSPEKQLQLLHWLVARLPLDALQRAVKESRGPSDGS